MASSKNKSQIGTLVALDVPQVTSQLFTMGFDFIFIDLEHGCVGEATIATLVSAKPAGCKVLIRIGQITEPAIRRALDIGCDGIVAPRVENPDEIDTLIAYSFYAPIGKRSVGFAPANKYGLKFNQYIENFRPLIYAQVESSKGVELAESMANNPHIAGIFVGPYDLSMSLGIPGQFDNPLFIDAAQKIRAVCAKHNKSFGTYTPNVQTAIEEIAKGANMIIVGADGNLFLNSYLAIIDGLKDR